jgi:hypothetical protein
MLAIDIHVMSTYDGFAANAGKIASASKQITLTPLGPRILLGTFLRFYVSYQSMKTRLSALAIISALMAFAHLRAAESLPMALDDYPFWRMITSFSEDDGTFRYENLLSNETSYQIVVPSLLKMRRAGAYIGVGPEQNFTYIANLEPRIAFIVDIRRQNMLEHLMYKALFEISSDRAEFVAQLFSRKRPAGIDATSTVQELFHAYDLLPCEARRRDENFTRVMDRLLAHGFALSSNDRQVIAHILETFCSGGPRIDYGFPNTPNLTAPSYSELMTTADKNGQNWSFLTTEDNFSRVRSMQLKNLIIPLTGDFAGPKTLRAVGNYLKGHDTTVTAFYLSNVEQYLNKDQTDRFRANVSFLPVTSTSVLIRFVPPESTTLERTRIFLTRTGTLFHLLDSGQ